MLDQGLAGPLDGRALGRELEPAVLALVASLASKWLAMTNTSLPLNSNSPTSGLRLAFHTALAGSIRPGDRVSAGSPFFLVTWVPVVDRLTVGAPASTNVTTAGLYRNTTRMLPPGWPPSWSLTGSISREPRR